MQYENGQTRRPVNGASVYLVEQLSHVMLIRV